MAFGRKPAEVDVVEVDEPAALVASATTIKLKDKKDYLTYKGNTGWQQDCWFFFDVVGEYASGCRWVGNLVSRARLFATYDDGSGPVAIDPKDSKHRQAYDLLDQLGGNAEDRAQMLREMGVHYTVAGESYLVAVQNKKTGLDDWGVYATGQVIRYADHWEIAGKRVNEALVIRTWEPHPNAPNKATSPSRAALPVLSQLQRLTQMADAQIDSRLAGAGLLLLPTGATFAGGGKEASSDEFMSKLTAAMSTAVANRGDASSLVPIVITADGDALEKIRHLTLDTPLDQHIGEMVDRSIKRVGLALDMPPEVLSGSMGDSNHWTAWAIDESSIKAHTEPLLRRIALDLARGYLIPILESRKVEDAWRYGIGVDTSEMRLRPNRSKEALELFDRGELSGETLRRETGFDDTDAPTPEDKVLWLVNKVAQGSTTPELVEAALKAMGVKLEVERPEAPVDQEQAQEARPTPSLREHPEQAPPEQDAALVAACEQLVFRALERAGNRLKTQAGVERGTTDPCDLYRVFSIDRTQANTLLADAWTKTPRYLARFSNVDHELVSKALDTYVRFLFMNQTVHTHAALTQFLAHTPLRAPRGTTGTAGS